MADLLLNVHVNDREVKELERHLRGSSGALDPLRRGAALAATAVAGVGVAGVVAGVQVTKMAATYSQTLQQIVGLAGVSQKTVDQWGKQMLRLAPQVAKPPQELAEALYFVASSGAPTAKAMDILTKSARASAAGLGDTQTVADALTSVINSYGAANISAANAGDTLTATVREGKGEASDFAHVIGTVVPLAAQLHVNFNDVGAALAAMTRLGTPAESASRQLAYVFQNLLKTTTGSDKAFASVNYSADAMLKTIREHGLLAGLTELESHVGGNTKALVQMFPSVQAIRGLLALVGKNAGSVAGIFHRMRDNTGDLDKAFAAASKGGMFRWHRLMAGIRALMITVGGLIQPLASKIAQLGIQGVGHLQKLIDAVSKAHGLKAKVEIVFDDIKTQALKLQALMDKVDWGKAFSEGLQQALSATGPVIKTLVDLLTKLFAVMPWEQIGKSLGPGFATMVLSAINALADPEFWRRNWELILSVAIAVFPVGKLFKVAEILGPFRKLGLDMAGELANALLERSYRLGDAFVKVIEDLGPKLLDTVKVLFGKLGGLSQFAIKVLGIDAAIHGIVGFAHDVEHWFGQAAGWVQDAWHRLFTWLETEALKTALIILEPFSHLPGKMGGWARDAKDSVNAELNKISTQQAEDKYTRLANQLNSLGHTKVNAHVDVLFTMGNLPAGVAPAPGFGKTGDGVISVTGKVAQAFLNKQRLVIHTGSGGGGGASAGGLSPHIRPELALAQSMGLTLTSGYRPGAVTVTGNPSLHAVGKAIDVAGSGSEMAAFARAVTRMPGVREVLYTPVGGWYPGAGWTQLSGALAQEHYSHVHVGVGDGRIGDGPGTGSSSDNAKVAAAAAEAAKHLKVLQKAAADAAKVLDTLKSRVATARTDVTDRALKAFDAETDRMLKGIDANLSKQEDAIDAWDKQLTPSESALSNLQASHDQAANASAISDAQTGVQSAQDRLSVLQSRGVTGPMLDQQKQAVADAQKTLSDAQYDQQVADLTKSADAERTARDASADAQKKAAEDAATEQEKQLSAQRDEERISFEKSLNQLLTHLEKQKATTKTKQDEMIKLLGSYGVDYNSAGDDLGTAFGDAFAGSVVTYLRIVAKELKSADLSDAANRIAKDAADAAKPKKHKLAAGGIVLRPVEALIGEAGPEAVVPLKNFGGQMGGHTFNFYFDVSGAIGDPDDIGRRLAAPVRRELLRTGKRVTNLWG